MTAPFPKTSVVLTSTPSMPCMDQTSCAFYQSAAPSFYALFASKVVGVVIAASILFSVAFRVLAPLADSLLAAQGRKQHRRRQIAAVCAVL